MLTQDSHNAMMEAKLFQLMEARKNLERANQYGTISEAQAPATFGQSFKHGLKELVGMNAMERGFQTVRDFKAEHGLMNPATMGDYVTANANLGLNALEATMAGADMAALSPFVAKGGRMAGNALEKAITANPGLFPDNQAGMVAWHGSPHKFAPTPTNKLGEFDLGKMGTGEGAQAYGHGTYLAEGKGTAKFYKEGLGQQNILIDGKRYDEVLKNRDAQRFLLEAKGNVDTAIEQAIDNVDHFTNVNPHVRYKKEAQKALDELNHAKATKNIVPHEGHLYEVDLPDSEIAKMLDWDKPLSEQPKFVRDKLKEHGIYLDEAVENKGKELIDSYVSQIDPKKQQEVRKALNEIVYGDQMSSKAWDTINANKTPFDPNDFHDFRDMAKWDINTGEQLYHKVKEKFGGDESELIKRLGKGYKDVGNMQQAVSEYLNELGIPGIKYLDQASRGAGEGTRNFVLFDPKKAKITGRQ